MRRRQPTAASEIERYLRTGQTDPLYLAWSHRGNILDRAGDAHADLRRALLARVRHLAGDRTHHPVPEHDTTALTRRTIEPMVRGLFPRAEQDRVLAMLEKSVVFVTSASIEAVLLADHGFDSTAWTAANLFLGSLGAELLGPAASRILGFSEGTSCYVSADYFAEESPFADFVVHEVAHIFHNCKRDTVGLRRTRTKEWLLDIAFQERETFAYSCEAYGSIVARAKHAASRRDMAREFSGSAPFNPKSVDVSKVASIVVEAAAARNGWRVILARCAAPKRIPRPQWIAAAVGEARMLGNPSDRRFR